MTVPRPSSTTSNICAIAVDQSSTAAGASAVVAVAREDKQFCVVHAATGTVAYTAKSFKRATALIVCDLPLPSGVAKVLLVADRAGEVTAWDCVDARKSRFLFGHTASMLTDLVLSPAGDFLFTADRDEKIRVSALPYGKPILNYCLGHTRCVEGNAAVGWL